MQSMDASAVEQSLPCGGGEPGQVAQSHAAAPEPPEPEPQSHSVAA
jgi:hypothetical protein